MTDKLRKKARELQAKTGMSYAAAKQHLTSKAVTREGNLKAWKGFLEAQRTRVEWVNPTEIAQVLRSLVKRVRYSHVYFPDVGCMGRLSRIEPGDDSITLHGEAQETIVVEHPVLKLMLGEGDQLYRDMSCLWLYPKDTFKAVEPYKLERWIVPRRTHCHLGNLVIAPGGSSMGVSRRLGYDSDDITGETPVIKVHRLAQEMDATIQSFCRAVAKQVRSWYIQAVPEFLAATSKTTEELPSEVAEHVQRLIQDAYAEATDRLDTYIESLWWHRAMDLHEGYRADLDHWDYMKLIKGEGDYSLRSNIHGKVQYLLMLLLDLFWHYGYIDLKDLPDWCVEYEDGGIQYTHYTRSRAPEFKWSDQMIGALQRYASLQKEARYCLTALRRQLDDRV